MKPLTLSEAFAEIARLPASRRAAASLGLAEAVLSSSGADPRDVTVFHPLECGPSDASRCAYLGRPLPEGNRVCAAALEPELACAGDRR